MSPHGISIHKDVATSDFYASMFVRDITLQFSILLSPPFDHHGFYAIDSEDEKLKDLLSFQSYGFLEYDFDKVLSSIMHNLILASKTFVEIALSKNEAGEVVGISLVPFDAIKIASFKRYSWFVSYRPDKKICFFKIERNRYIHFNIKELGLKKKGLKKIVRRLKKINITTPTEFITDDKMKTKFSFDEFRKKQDFLILKYPQKIGWMGGGSNPFLSESYSLFRTAKLKEFQWKCLSFFIKKINIALNNISNITKATGTIKTTASFPKYKNEWKRYRDGDIFTSQLSSILFPKSSKSAQI